MVFCLPLRLCVPGWGEDVTLPALRPHVARFKEAQGWLAAIYFGLTACSQGYIYLVKLLAI